MNRIACACVGLLAVAAGCGAGPTEAQRTSTSADSVSDPANVVVALSASDDYGPVTVTLSKRFQFGDTTRDACGGDYSIDATVDVGRVTGDSIEIRSVTYVYHPNAAVDQAPDAFMSDFSNGTPGYTVYTSGGFADASGITQTFDIGRVLTGTRAAAGAAAILYHRTHLALGDRTDVCGMTTKIILQT